MEGMFCPDLFSDATPKFRDAPQPLVSEVSAILREHYRGIGVPESRMFQSGAIEVNSNNFLVRAGRERYIVKRWPAGSAAEIAARRTQAALANWLALGGVALPRVVEAGDAGELVVEHGGISWCVLHFVDGAYFSGQGEEFLHAGIAMRALFRALHAAPDALRVAQAIRHSPAQAQDMLSALDRDRSRWPSIFGQPDAARLRDAWTDIATALADTLRIEPDLDATTALCHIDLHPHNVLVSGGRVTTFLDFCSLLRAPVGSMVAFNLFKLARQSIVARGAGGLQADVRALRDRVLDDLAASGLIPGHAPAALARLAKAEILRRLLLIVRLNVERADRDWNHVLPVQIRALREADVLFS